MSQQNIGSGPDPIRINPSSGAQGSKSARGTSKSESPAFHVLLERLQAQASELETKTPTVADAKELAGAVDIARASLDDALSLSDRLLEAFRESQLMNDPSGDSNGDGAKERRS